VQSDRSGQARLTTAEFMEAFAIEAECVAELVIDGLDHLAYPRQLAAEPLGPVPCAVAFGRAEHARAVELIPGHMIGSPLKALVHHVRAVGRCPRSMPLRLWEAAEGKKPESPRFSGKTSTC